MVGRSVGKSENLKHIQKCIVTLFRELESLVSFYRTWEKETILYGFKTHSDNTKSSSNPLVEQNVYSFH